MHAPGLHVLILLAVSSLPVPSLSRLVQGVLAATLFTFFGLRS